MDTDAIALGEDFVEAIETTVAKCDVLIAVIGNNWLTSKDDRGNRRLGNPEDFVRMEIGAALKRKIRVIPVLVDNALMPQSTDLPEDLKPLVRRNALLVTQTSFHGDCQRLAAAIKLVLEKAAAEEKEHKETKHLEAEQRQGEEKGRLPVDGPTVFLCHETRDEPAAEDLAEKLQRLGIKIWHDRQHLRGGDDWWKAATARMIEQTDYVVVLQSPRMLDKPESFVNVEIHCALEQQSHFSPDVRFIIPVLLEVHPDLPRYDLRDFSSIDITRPEGVDKLAEVIHDDWRRRRAIARSSSARRLR